MKHINNLIIVLRRTITNKNNTQEVRENAKEALNAIRETKRKLDDPQTYQEATDSLWRTFRPRKFSEINEKEI